MRCGLMEYNHCRMHTEWTHWRGVELFQKMPERGVVSWKAIIAGYAWNGHCEEALKLF
jgi:hypothetical protein